MLAPEIGVLPISYREGSFMIIPSSSQTFPGNLPASRPSSRHSLNLLYANREVPTAKLLASRLGCLLDLVQRKSEPLYFWFEFVTSWNLKSTRRLLFLHFEPLSNSKGFKILHIAVTRTCLMRNQAPRCLIATDH